jgi:hypothetical protein
MLKKILYVALGIIALPFLIGLFIKNDFGVERSVVIQKPLEEVFDYVSSVQNQANYAVWSQMDPDMKVEFIGIDRTVGFSSFWESDNPNVGSGKQIITNIEVNKRVDHKLEFTAPMESEANSWMLTEDAGEGQTKVTWGFETHTGYPMNMVFSLLGIEEAIGKDYETGLVNLKAILD